MVGRVFFLLAGGLFFAGCAHAAAQPVAAPLSQEHTNADEPYAALAPETSPEDAPDPVADTDELVGDTPDAGEPAGTAKETEGGVPLLHNRHVAQFIDYFQGRGRDRFALWLYRSGTYIPVMESLLAAEGLPPNLVYLALIESGFSPTAYSRAAAVGFWQFMEPTGKQYGLRIDDWVDERRDPIKATRAAARYLKDLYARFGDWHLAAAGYNAGENKIARAMRRYGTQDYWELIKHRGYIRTETKQYVPKLIAAITIAENPRRYGFEPQYGNPLTSQTVLVPGGADLYRLAYAAGVTFAELKRLNPELRRWMTPPDVDLYALQVPPGAAEGLLERFASVPPEVRAPMLQIELGPDDDLLSVAARYKVRLSDIRLLNPGLRGRAGETVVLPVDSEGLRYADRARKPPLLSYRVRAGDTLSRISRKHHISVAELKKYNRLRSSRIRVGQTLRIPVYLPEPSSRRYTVRSGDTLTEIAHRFRVSTTRLAEHNDLKNGRIRSGQELMIP